MDWSTWMDKKVYSRLNFALPAFFKKTCALCLDINHAPGFICSRCEEALPDAKHRCQICAISLPNQGYCRQCLHKKPAFDYSHSSFTYAAPIDAWLQRLKTKRKTEWAHKLASLMVLKQPGNLAKVDAFTFVPSTRWSLMKRGFNPAELIARELGRALHKPVIARLATRSHSLEQKRLSRDQRINNVGLHFHATRKTLNGEHIMLIDDVMTTGSTAHSMALIIKDAGASQVDVWCLARTPKH
ncbi:MAG: ComF family protein [Oleispira sp.]|jgi:ComF family protein